MAYGRKWKPSKTKVREFASLMEDIEIFCAENAISSSHSNDSYYFNIKGINYRVSNHTIEKSNANSYGRAKYHGDSRDDDTIYIHASKTRIMEIYGNLVKGYQLNGRGGIVL